MFKKSLVFAVAIVLVAGFGFPGRGSAQTGSEATIQALQAQIQALLAQIQQLQAQLATVQGGGVVVNPNGPLITSFIPSSGPVGTKVTAYGSGFTGLAGVGFEGAVNIGSPVYGVRHLTLEVVNDGVAAFVVPATITYTTESSLTPQEVNVVPGVYQVVFYNDQVKSNVMRFQVGSTSTVTPGQKFQVGDSVQAVDYLNIRENPGGPALGVANPGYDGVVLAGPAQSGAYYWWQIKWSKGNTGWSVEDWLDKKDVTTPGWSAEANKAPYFAEDSFVSPTSVGADDSNWWRVKGYDPESGDLKYTINWGDGTSNTYSLRSGGDVAATHVYGDVGTYRIEAKVGDSKGATASRFLTVSVIDSSTVLNAPSTKFKVGDGVQTTDNLNVRTGPSGVNKGVQLPGAKGVITGGPVWSIMGGWWWAVNYDAGEDGWSAEEWLVKTTKDGTPSTPSITVTSPNGGDVWRMGSTNYISWKMPNDQIYHVELYLMPQGSTPVITTPPAPGNTGVMVDSRVGGYGFGGLILTYPASDATYTSVLNAPYPPGTYKIRAYLLPKDTTGLDLSKVIAQDESDSVFSILGSYSLCGDIDGNGVINQLDLDNPSSTTDITDYVFGGVLIPSGLNVDLNGDGVPNIIDVTILTNYLKRGGPAPTCSLVNLPPTNLSIAGPANVTGMPNPFWDFKATDPEGGRLKYTIDWGDGTPPLVGSNLASGESWKFNYHTYSLPGTRTVTFTANDDRGLISNLTYAVTLDSTQKSSNFICGDVNQDGVIASADITQLNDYAFNGVPIPDNKIADMNGNGVVDIIDVTLLTNFVSRGGAAPSCGGQGSQAPTITSLSGPNIISVQEIGGTLNLNLSAVTVDPEGGVINYSVDWGDGNKSTSAYTAASGATVAMPHTYSGGGKFIVRVSAVDPTGLAAVKSHLVEAPRVNVNFSDFSIDSRSGLKSGDLVITRDSQNVLTGVGRDGGNGNFLIHAYGDDVITPSVDEGHGLNEVVKFYVNGKQCTVSEGRSTWIPRASSNIVLSCPGITPPATSTPDTASVLSSINAQLQAISNQLNAWLSQ